MDWNELVEHAGAILEKEPRLVLLPARGRAVFVGDTHGDIEATRSVVRRFLVKGSLLVFLGDYVDRGEFSRENLHLLLNLKRERPEEIFLLAGNHEGYLARAFYPADFWQSLAPPEQETLGRLLSKLPLAATTRNGVLALHGALPEVDSLEDVNRIAWGDSQWERMVWGDFVEGKADRFGDLGGRPQFGRAYFDKGMERYQKKVLIRSHQPMAPPVMYDKRCITIFTSLAYVPNRTVAVVDLEREIVDAEDILLERV